MRSSGFSVSRRRAKSRTSNGDGEVLLSLQDPAADYPTMTGACETRERLYLTRLFGHDLPYIDKADLPR